MTVEREVEECCVPLPVTSSRRARGRRHSVPRTQRLLRLTIVSRDGALAPRLGPAECGGGFGERKIRRCFLEGWVHLEQLSIELRGSRETKDEQQKADQTIWDRRSCERGSGRHVLRQLEVGSSCGRKIDFCGSGIGRARLRGSGRHNRRSNDYRKLRTSSRRQTRRSGIGGPGNVAPGDTAFGSSRLEVLVGSCEDMDIGVLKKEELLLLAVELSLDINSRLRKPEIRSAIIEGGFEEDELSEAWEKICDPTVGHPRVESFGGGGVCCVPLPVTSSRRARGRRHSVPRTQRLLRLTIVSRDGALAPRLGPAECGGGFGERKIRRCFLEGWVHLEQLSIELRGSRVPGGRFTPLIPPSDCGPPLPFVKWTDGPR
ncbi:hypothetical protein HPB51_004506 [Rhipicephalus microplus]|uniref:Uncharacterized protein n=1 Tax=Rhipicephalus microplus TaxID=6941 RepID=A0A9J6ELA3_RHIMP|nr:hypothetical protein HPB51_004506 [Rhipicephalus microplus]